MALFYPETARCRDALTSGNPTGSAAGSVEAMPDLTIPVSGTDLAAYLARPPVGDGPWPAVVVLHDAFGLTTNARVHADRLAAAGYLAIVPDLYSRGGMLRCVKSTFTSLLRGTGTVYDDIEAVRAWLLRRDDGTGRVGTIGFCMGGGFALMTVARGWDASSANYGPLPRDLAVLDGACPVVGSYGGADRSLRGAAAALDAALSERGVPHDVKEYPGAGHGFLDRLNVGPAAPLLRVAGLGYHQRSAEDAWERILRFFAEHLVTSPR